MNLNVFKYNFVVIRSVCIRYWWICNSDVPFTEEEMRRFFQKLKTRVTSLVISIFYVQTSLDSTLIDRKLYLLDIFCKVIKSEAKWLRS
jgi:hypothetical protein